MINLAMNTDVEEIKEYCDKNGFKFPESNSLYISRNENGVINGITGLEIVIKIEPFISDNPIVAKKLYDKILTILQEQNIKKVECFTPDTNKSKVHKLFEKLGFKFAENTNRYIKLL